VESAHEFVIVRQSWLALSVGGFDQQALCTEFALIESLTKPPVTPARRLPDPLVRRELLAAGRRPIAMLFDTPNAEGLCRRKVIDLSALRFVRPDNTDQSSSAERPPKIALVDITKITSETAM
jgi:hypothetical protein